MTERVEGMWQMAEHEWLAERFEENRTHLRAVAYRMLGSLSETDDAVQEGWLRLSRSDISGVENLHPRIDPIRWGQHRAKVLAINADGLFIGPVEAIDGTPVVDIKPVVEESKDF